MASGLAALTPEQKAENMVRAQAARAAKAEARKASTLRRDFLDAPTWDRLASALGVRMAPWGEPATASGVRRILKRAGRTPEWWKERSGDSTLSDFGRLNPTWPQRAFDGLVLEAVAAEQRLELVPELELVPA